jgi:hypothetical protein
LRTYYLDGGGRVRHATTYKPCAWRDGGQVASHSPRQWLIYFCLLFCLFSSFLHSRPHLLSQNHYARSVGTSSYSHSTSSGRLDRFIARNPLVRISRRITPFTFPPIPSRTDRRVTGSRVLEPFPAAGRTNVRHRRPRASCCIHRHHQRRLLWVHRQLLTNAHHPRVRLFERIAAHPTISPRPDGL